MNLKYIRLLLIKTYVLTKSYVFISYDSSIWDKSLCCILFLENSAFIWSAIHSFLSCLELFIFTFWYLILLSLWPYTYLRFLFDPLYEEIVTSTSDLIGYLVRHAFFELVLPLSIFIAVMLTLFVDWSWIPISNVDRKRLGSLEKVKKQLFE